MDGNEIDYLHAAAGLNAFLKYECRGCKAEIFTHKPVKLVCLDCDRKLISTDIV